MRPGKLSVIRAMKPEKLAQRLFEGFYSYRGYTLSMEQVAGPSGFNYRHWTVYPPDGEETPPDPVYPILDTRMAAQLWVDVKLRKGNKRFPFPEEIEEAHKPRQGPLR